jgi:hypothetical protein
VCPPNRECGNSNKDVIVKAVKQSSKIPPAPLYKKGDEEIAVRLSLSAELRPRPSPVSAFVAVATTAKKDEGEGVQGGVVPHQDSIFDKRVNLFHEDQVSHL